MWTPPARQFHPTRPHPRPDPLDSGAFGRYGRSTAPQWPEHARIAWCRPRRRPPARPNTVGTEGALEVDTFSAAVPPDHQPGRFRAERALGSARMA